MHSQLEPGARSSHPCNSNFSGLMSLGRGLTYQLSPAFLGPCFPFGKVWGCGRYALVS